MHSHTSHLRISAARRFQAWFPYLLLPALLTGVFLRVSLDAYERSISTDNFQSQDTSVNGPDYVSIDQPMVPLWLVRYQVQSVSVGTVSGKFDVSAEADMDECPGAPAVTPDASPRNHHADPPIYCVHHVYRI